VGGETVAPAALLLATALAVFGTQLSRPALDATSDEHFRRWSRGLTIAIAALCLVKGLYLLGAGSLAARV